MTARGDERIAEAHLSVLASILGSRAVKRSARWANRDLSKCGSTVDQRYQPAKDCA